MEALKSTNHLYSIFISHPDSRERFLVRMAFLNQNFFSIKQGEMPSWDFTPNTIKPCYRELLV